MISAAEIRRLAEITLVLEPVIDKTDCTTRFVDLPGKPLIDFLIAGVNVGSAIENYADSVISHGNDQIYSHYTDILNGSNKLKSKKYINVGLIEVLLVMIKARLTSNNLDDALESFKSVIKNAPKKDLQNYQNAFHLAWGTSNNSLKKDNLAKFDQIAADSNNMLDRFEQVVKMFPDPDFSSYQVALEYVQGFPTIKRYIQEIDEEKGLIKSIEDSFNKMHSENPVTKIGWLADLSAGAIFLYLSYQDLDSYIIK